MESAVITRPHLIGLLGVTCLPLDHHMWPGPEVTWYIHGAAWIHPFGKRASLLEGGWARTQWVACLWVGYKAP